MTHNINFDDGIKDFFHPFYPKPLTYDFSPVKIIFNGDTKPSLEKMIDKKNDLLSKGSLASKQYLNDIFTNLFSTAKLIEDTSKVVENDVIETNPIYNKKERTPGAKKKTKEKAHNYQLVEEGAGSGGGAGAGGGAEAKAKAKEEEEEEGEWTIYSPQKKQKNFYGIVDNLFNSKINLEPTRRNYDKLGEILHNYHNKLTAEEVLLLQQKMENHKLVVDKSEIEKEEAKKAKKAKKAKAKK